MNIPWPKKRPTDANDLKWYVSRGTQSPYCTISALSLLIGSHKSSPFPKFHLNRCRITGCGTNPKTGLNDFCWSSGNWNGHHVRNRAPIQVKFSAWTTLMGPYQQGKHWNSTSWALTGSRLSHGMVWSIYGISTNNMSRVFVFGTTSWASSLCENFRNFRPNWPRKFWLVSFCRLCIIPLKPMMYYFSAFPVDRVP